MEYIYTFYSHYGAIRMNKECSKRVLSSVLMPVPRMLSSSCGTCCKINCDIAPDNITVFLFDDLPADIRDEIEQIAVVRDNAYDIIYSSI